MQGITPSIVQLLLVQLGAAGLLWLLIVGRMTLPFGVKILTVIAYITVPVLLAVKGKQSAIYLSDFVFPFLMWSIMARGAHAQLWSSHSFNALAVLLIILPLLFGLTYMSTKGVEAGFGARDIKGDAIWLYRNATFLLLFGYGMSLNLSPGQFTDFIKINIVFAFVLSLFGLVNYFGPFNLAFFDYMSNQIGFQEDYGASRIGAGFMGLFRGSVGQWFATIVVLTVGVQAALSPLYKKLAIVVFGVGIGMILFSYSRAGLVGACLGLVLLSLFGSGFKQRLTGFMGIAAVAGWLVWQSAAVLNRVSTIYTGKSDMGGRLDSWQHTLNYFSHNLTSLLLGVGPTNRQAVAEIAGTYGAHNEYLDVIYRFGITGVITLLVVIGILIFSFARLRKATSKQNIPLINTVIVVFFANCVIGISQEHLFHDYASYTMGFFLYLFYGMALGVQWHSASAEEIPIQSDRPVGGVRMASMPAVRLKAQADENVYPHGNG